MMKLKRFFALFAALLFLFAPAAAASNLTKQHNWFVKPRSDHSQPEVFGGLDFPYKYGSLAMGSPDEKVVYFTFDAGYTAESLRKILDTLKEEEVPAVFFILPGMIRFGTDLVMRMIDEGHIVANHSYSHKNMSNITSKDALLKELTDLEAVYKEYTGKEMSKYFRPPEGSFSELNLQHLNELGYTPVFWSFAYADWDNGKQKPHDWAKSKILDNLHNGMVLLLHPNSETNAAILGDVIKEMKAQGYRFGTVDELINLGGSTSRP